MVSTVKGLIVALITIALAASLGFTSASAATGSTGDTNDFEFEVIGTSHDEASASTTLKNTQQALIDGATQALWQESDYGVKLTPNAVKDAWKHRIKVVATGANSSQVIYKKSKHRKLVVLSTGSKVRNTGKLNQRRVGFIWTIKNPAIVKYDKASKQYRHAASLLTKSEVTALQKTAKGKEYKVVGSIMVGGTRLYIVIWCGNYIGGNVEMITRLIMVRFAEDLLMESEAESVAKTGVTFDFKVTCPANGATFNVQGFAWAYGKASSKVTYSQRTRVATIGDLEYQAKQNISINQSTETDAQSSVKITGSCGSQEETYQAPTASGAAKACVDVGEQNGVITASGTNPNNVAAPGTLTVGGQTKQFASVGAGSSVTWDFSGFAPGTYNGSFSLGAPINKSATFTVTVNACVRQPGSIVEVTDINDVRYGSTRTWRIRGMVPEGQSAVLKVSARIGTVKESDKSIALASGAFDLTITYTAPTEGSTDTLTAMLFGSNGVKDDEKSDTFNLLPNPVDP